VRAKALAPFCFIFLVTCSGCSGMKKVIGSPTIGGIVCGEGGQALADFSHTEEAVSAVFLLMDGLGSICGTFSICD
jgi:hypothetical protein